MGQPACISENTVGRVKKGTGLGEVGPFCKAGERKLARSCKKQSGKLWGEVLT